MNILKSGSVLKTVLLLVITGLLIWAFQIHYERLQADDQPLKAVIIQTAHSNEDVPLIAAYRWHRTKHWLILYSVDLSDRLLFKAIHRQTIDGPAEELMADKKSNGVWVKISNEWHYFNEKLQEEERDEGFRNRSSNMSYPFSVDHEENVVQVMIDDEHSLQFSITDHEQLQALYPLSRDQDIWLGVFTNDLKIIMK